MVALHHFAQYAEKELTVLIRPEDRIPRDASGANMIERPAKFDTQRSRHEASLP
jgi:hypothetical protein